MAMHIVLTETAATPLYRQIYQQVRDQIIKGELPSGYCLPPIRSVALELRISVITVKKAWEELEHDGYIYSMVGRGCFVAMLTEPVLDDRRDRLVRDKLYEAVEHGRSVGMTKQEMTDLIELIMKNIYT